MGADDGAYIAGGDLLDLMLCPQHGLQGGGIGSGLAIRYGGAIDGVEVMAVIFAKPMGISVGTFVMVYNVLLYIVCGLVLKSWILPLYSIVTYAAALKTIDFIVDGLDRAKCAIIITEHEEEICAKLCEVFGLKAVSYLWRIRQRRKGNKQELSPPLFYPLRALRLRC